MILLAGFLDVLFRAVVFIGLAFSVGGIAFHYLVLSPSARGKTADGIEEGRTVYLIGVGAFLAAAAQFLTLVIAPWALADETGRWPLAAFLATRFARMAIVFSALSFCLGCASLRLRRPPFSARAWRVAAFLATLTLASGAWLVHGASRLNHAPSLMTVTVLHQLGAVVWVGGTIHLTAQWRLLRGSQGGWLFWPQQPARFSPVAIGSVMLLVTSGAYLSWHYIAGVGGLVGTAYGTMLITKVILMVVVLCLGGLNFLAIRHWKANGDERPLIRRVPVFIELEAGIGIIILMAAAAFTAQPPAVDVRAQWATPAEIANVFAPKQPRIAPAPLAEMQASAPSSLDLYALPGRLLKIQSNFNHNISGLFVILLGIAALADRLIKAPWLRHWPLLFLPFALFLLVFAEPGGWPLGREGFWETMAAPDVLQHRLATLLVACLGLFQWNVRAGALATTRWRYAFPLLCGVGGGLLLTHSHSVFAVKWAFLIEVSHNAIGVLAVLMGAGRWLELRLPRRESSLAGCFWPVCLMLVGVVLLFYREI